MKLRIGHLSTFYHTAILLMAKGEAGQRLGIELEWRLLGTGPAIIREFQRGGLDLAYIGLPPAIIGIDQGVPVICIAGGHVEGTVMAGKSGWTSFPEAHDAGAVLHQFHGKTIGVPGKGSIHDVILKDLLDRSGMEGSIEVRNYAWADLLLDAVVRDEVSAAVGTPALAAAIKRFAGGKVLVPPSELWKNNPSYGIVVHKDLLRKDRVLIEGFLGLHEEATAFIRNRPSEAARLIADFVGIVDADLVLDTLGISPKYCAHLTDAYVSSTLQFVPALRRHGYIKSEIGEDRIFFRDVINSVHPGTDHYGEGIAL